MNAPLSANLQTPYISAVLKSHQNIPVEVLDANLMGWSMQKTLEELKKRSPRLLGIHMVYLWGKTAEVFDMLSRLRSLSPQTHINLFGFFPTFSYKEILQRFPFIDSITIGEPEYTFLELAQSIINNSQKIDYSDIDGLAFAVSDNTPVNNNEGHRIVKNRPRAPIPDLDGLPFPDRNHLHQHEGSGIATYILGSRGCYGHCTFCYINPFYGNGSAWRGRSAENVFEEIRSLYNGQSIQYFYFADANFFGPGREGRERASQLADLTIKGKLKIRFGIECRANDIEEGNLSRLVRAGLCEVFLGIESGSQHVLNRFKKGVSTDINARAVETLRRFGIEPSQGFIMFHPDSRLADVRENLEFLKKLKLLHTPAVTAHILHHRQTFFRGTPDFPLALSRPGTRLEPTTGYEAFCEFNDPKVAAFSEVATSLCRNVLDMLRPDDADVCNTGNENGGLAVINDAVINSYERMLKSFEDGEAAHDVSQARRIHDKLLEDIGYAYRKRPGENDSQ
ncbi:MAG: B12-binding domain-containing radical SAM protein [Candidatus Brocadiales bacterium]